MARSTKEVFLNHLLLLCDWDIETDIKTNYAPDCTIITSSGVFDGPQRVVQFRQILSKEFSAADFLYTTKRWAGEVAFLEWQAHTDGFHIDDGVETFLILNGMICVQTIRYTLHNRASRSSKAMNKKD